MPVPCLPQSPRLMTSPRRRSVAVGCQELPSRLTTRRCSLGRIVIEPEDECIAIFSKYQSGIARRLKKSEAITMLMKEFELDESEADTMFTAFDKDGNEVMSLWEFRQFYQTVGKHAQPIIKLFKSVEVEGSGKIDIGKAFDALQEVEIPKGKLTDEEIETYLKGTAGEEKEIDFSKFLNMMCRIYMQK